MSEGLEPGSVPGQGETPDLDLAAGAGVGGDTSLLAGNFGATPGGAGAVPSMIGDFFGNNYRYAFANGATVATAGGDRHFKYAENTNPFPTDRVFFNYHFFDDPLQDMTGRPRDLNRFTFGLEKTFCEELFSFEFRLPFAAALNADQNFVDPSPMATEFGNLAVAAKILVYQNQRTALAAGLAMVFPTGDDSVVSNLYETPNSIEDDRVDLIFENGSLFLQPFIGIYRAPTERLFHQFLAQVDFDVNGSDVIIPGNSALWINGGTNAGESARLNAQTLLYLDYQVGFWLYRNPCAGLVTGVAPLLELHYTSTLQDLDVGPFNTGRNGNLPQLFVPDMRRDTLNLTSGVYLELFQETSVKLAAVAPLLEDNYFDYELGLQVVHLY